MNEKFILRNAETDWLPIIQRIPQGPAFGSLLFVTHAKDNTDETN